MGEELPAMHASKPHSGWPGGVYSARSCWQTPGTSPLQVYEHLVFKGSRHVSMRSLPGMRERCIRIGSAGKTFSLTAWKVRCCAAT